MVLSLQSAFSSCVVNKKVVQVTPACITLTDNTLRVLVIEVMKYIYIIQVCLFVCGILLNCDKKHLQTFTVACLIFFVTSHFTFTVFNLVLQLMALLIDH